MFVRSRGVWFGLGEKMFTFNLLGEIQKTCFLAKTPRLSSVFKLIFIYEHNGLSLQLLEKTWQQLFLWVINLSSWMCNLSCYCKRTFPASVGLFGDNKLKTDRPVVLIEFWFWFQYAFGVAIFIKGLFFFLVVLFFVFCFFFAVVLLFFS